MYKFIFLFFIFLLFFSNCSKHKTSQTNGSNKEKNKLTIFLIDVSGSFNKIQKGGFFKGKNYFELSCKEIDKYLTDSVKLGSEYIIIREITNNSFEDTAFVQKIDLLAKKFPPLKNPFRRKIWEKEKKEYEKKLKLKFESRIKSAKNNLRRFKKEKANNFSSRTDILKAFESCEFYNNNSFYNNFEKEIIAYTDLRDNVNNISDKIVDLSNFKCEIKFLSKEGLNKKKFIILQSTWKKILKCKKIIFKTPEESIQ